MKLSHKLLLTNALPYIGVLLVDFYLLPLLIIDTGTAMVMLLIITPLICFITSIVYGLKRPFCWFYAVTVAALFIPSIYIYYNSSAWFYVVVYGIIALIGNTMGFCFTKRLQIVPIDQSSPKRHVETPRLILRDWTEKDIPDFARLNSDDRVMEYFLKKLSYQETIDFYNRIQEEFRAFGFGLYAVERTQDHAFIGYVGLHNITFEVDFAPAVEIGWRLLPEYWGKGYATEAATACLNYAKNELKLKEVVSFTSLPNKRSEHVMQKIGMTRIKEFNHPLVEPNHPLYRHILYRMDLATLEK